MTRTARRLGAALGLAVAVHVVVWSVLRVWPIDAACEDDDVTAEPTGEITAVALAPNLTAAIPEISLASLRGPADELGAAQTHPLPAVSVDIPGVHAASAGGGAHVAGDTAFTERRDPSHDDALRHEIDNAKPGHQSAHEHVARTAESPEAIHRDREQAIGDRARAKSGSVASTGDSRGQGRGLGAHAAGADAAAGPTTPPPRDGTSQSTTTAPMTEPGARATDTPVRAPAPTDTTSAAAASHETAPGPFEITPASVGGTARTGVVGPEAPGQLARAPGSDTAATTARVPAGRRDLTTTADAQDPYFRALFARLGSVVEFPHDLALAMRSGHSVALFTLRADGTIADLSIEVPSLPGFDRSLTRGINGLKRLPPPPPRLLAGRPAMRVRIAWDFDAGILR